MVLKLRFCIEMICNEKYMFLFDKSTIEQLSQTTNNGFQMFPTKIRVIPSKQFKYTGISCLIKLKLTKSFLSHLFFVPFSMHASPIRLFPHLHKAPLLQKSNHGQVLKFVTQH